MALAKFKRTLTIFATSLLVFSYLHDFEMRALGFNKFLLALIASELKNRVLRDKE